MNILPARDGSSFGVWVRRIRMTRGLTQDALAEQVGCATATIRKIETGERRPSFQMAARLAQILDLPAESRLEFMELARFSAAEQNSPDSDSLPASDTPKSSSLPSYFTPFLGRDREVIDLRQRLQSRDYRLVTLLGVGGVGKTRLAVEVAREMTEFRDGITFVSLATLSDPDDVTSTIATALGFHFSGPVSPVNQLVQFLSDKHVLLILDTVEHLLEPGGLLIDLIVQALQLAPQVKLLITSRERLKLQAEWVVEVAGLTVGPARMDGRMPTSPAIQLFFEHARRVRHDYVPSASDGSAVAEICQLVGGLPLGLELAASWIRILSPQEISQELSTNFHISPIAPQDFPERHHSLAAVFHQSWQLLTKVERQTLQRLAVFRGGFSREAAEAVAGASLALLVSLVDKSLLRRLPNAQYELHQLIRQFALEQLQQSSAELQDAYRLHSTYYRSLLQRTVNPQTTEPNNASLVLLIQNIGNLRAAWNYAVSHADQETILAIARGLVLIYDQQAWLHDGVLLFERARASLQTAGIHTGAALGVVTGYQGYFEFFIRPGRAESLIEQGIGLLADAGEVAERAFLLVQLGNVAHAQARFELSYQRQMMAYELAETSGDKLTYMAASSGLAILDIYAGKLAQAEQRLRTCILERSHTTNTRWIASALNWLSAALRYQGQYEQAERYAREGMQISSAAHHIPGIARAFYELGMLACEHAELDLAEYLLHESCAAFQSIGRPWMYGRSRAALISLQLQQEQRGDARQGCRELLELVSSGALVLLAEATLSVAVCLQAEQRTQEARALLDAFGQQSGEYATLIRLAQLKDSLTTDRPASALQAADKPLSAQQLVNQMQQLLSNPNHF